MSGTREKRLCKQCGERARREKAKWVEEYLKLHPSREKSLSDVVHDRNEQKRIANAAAIGPTPAVRNHRARSLLSM